MELGRKAIEEFKEIYSQETGKEISDKEARELAEGLLSLFKIICRPIAEKEERQKKYKHPSGSL
jgi:hypothetical protein